MVPHGYMLAFVRHSWDEPQVEREEESLATEQCLTCMMIIVKACLKTLGNYLQSWMSVLHGSCCVQLNLDDELRMRCFFG